MSSDSYNHNGPGLANRMLSKSKPERLGTGGGSHMAGYSIVTQLTRIGRAEILDFGYLSVPMVPVESKAARATAA